MSAAHVPGAEEFRLEFLAADLEAPGQVPDIRGLSLREAVVALSARGYQARVAGSGTVLEQVPPPGAALAGGGACAIRLGAPEDSAAPAAASAAPEPEPRRLAAVPRPAVRRRSR